jgi:lipid-binding SYLF domain-containing protein
LTSNINPSLHNPDIGVFSTMKIHPALALLFLIAPTVATADLSLEGVKEGAAKAAKAVGDTTKGAVDAVTGTIGSTKESLGDEVTPEETRAKLDLMAETTLARLMAEQPGSRALLDQSAGYAVFDKREASFYVVAGYGRGVAVDAQTAERVYMKMATTGAGLSFGLGGFASQLVILFEDSARFREFVAEGLDATAGVGAMVGDEKEELGVRFDDGKAVFVLTGKGWKVAAKLTGSRYWPDEGLNP